MNASAVTVGVADSALPAEAKIEVKPDPDGDSSGSEDEEAAVAEKTTDDYHDGDADYGGGEEEGNESRFLNCEELEEWLVYNSARKEDQFLVDGKM
eukprot:10003002-Heterocapsa_arctica.AAC.1